LLLPAKPPAGVIAKIHAAMKKAITNPATSKQLYDMGYQVVANNPEQFGVYLREQITTWTKIVKDNKIKAD
jgi:tripartite-type tricarboxylate transporter receptor subunit TctC